MATALLAAAYFAAAKFGLSLAFVNASATAIWPPTGIAIAAFLLLGYRVWPGIFLGAFLANLTTAGSLATSLGIGLGNTREGLTREALDDHKLFHELHAVSDGEEALAFLRRCYVTKPVDFDQFEKIVWVRQRLLAHRRDAPAAR